MGGSSSHDDHTAAKRSGGGAPGREHEQFVAAEAEGALTPSARSGYAAYQSPLRDGAIPDLNAIPSIGSRQRDDDERAVVARAREMVFECDGRLRDALYELEAALRDRDAERSTRLNYEIAREYARALVSHVEQCWATAVTR